MPTSLKALADPRVVQVAPELYRIPPTVPLDGRVLLSRIPQTVVPAPKPVPLVPIPIPLPLPSPGRRKPEPVPTTQETGLGGLPDSLTFPTPPGLRLRYRLTVRVYNGSIYRFEGAFRNYAIVLTDPANNLWSFLVEREYSVCRGDWFWSAPLHRFRGKHHVLGVEPLGWVQCSPRALRNFIPDLVEIESPEPRRVPQEPPLVIPVFPAQPVEEPEQEEQPAAPMPLEPAELPRPATPALPKPARPPLREPSRVPERLPVPRPRRPQPQLPVPRPSVPLPVPIPRPNPLPRPDPLPRQPPPLPEPKPPSRRRQPVPVLVRPLLPDRPPAPESQPLTLPDPTEIRTQTEQNCDFECLKRWCLDSPTFLRYWTGGWDRQGYSKKSGSALVQVPSPLVPAIEYLNARLADLKEELIEAIDLAAFQYLEPLESWPKAVAHPYWEIYWGLRERGKQSLKRIRVPGEGSLAIPKPPEISDGRHQLIVIWRNLSFPYTRIWGGENSIRAVENWLRSFKGEFQVRVQENPSRSFKTGRFVPTRRRHWDGTRWLPPERWPDS